MPRAEPIDVDFSELEAAANRSSRRDRDPRSSDVDHRDRGSQPGRALAWMALVTGWLWIIGFAATTYAFLGLEGLLGLNPVFFVALGVGAIMPAFMMWFAGAAAQEAARARAEARRLADAADELANPSPTAEAATRRLAVAVRGEITALDRALEGTLVKLDQVDQMVAQHARNVEDAAAMAKEGAGAMVSGLDAERAALIALSNDLEAQAQSIIDMIHRQTRQVAEAARLADEGVRTADETLDARLSSFGAAAALIVDRTRQLSAAAQESGDSASRLETALDKALDVLARATKLTDASRQSAEEAALAANATAGAVRETTARAVDEARRAAEMIRGETRQPLAPSRSYDALPPASSSYDRERDMDRGAGLGPASTPAPAPVPTPATAPVKRFSLFGRKATPEEKPVERPAAAVEKPANRPMFTPRPALEPERPAARSEERRERDNPFTAPDRFDRTDRFDRPVERQEARVSGGDDGWTWRDLLSSVDAPAQAVAPAPAAPAPVRRLEVPAPRDEAPREDALARLTRSVSHLRAVEPASGLAIVEAAGVRVGEVFSMGALDRIAHRARNGTQARRRAVRDAAADAVTRLAAHLDADPQARQDASGFMSREGARIAELLGRGRASMGSDATRAFLLLDAALG